MAILEEDSPALFGLDWLTFFDEVTNTVLMPVCALFSCLLVGWVIKPENMLADLENSGTTLPGWLKKVFPFMTRYLTPLLILIVEISGIVSEIESNNIAVVVFALILIVISIVLYFLFLKNSETGTNADEKIKA